MGNQKNASWDSGIQELLDIYKKFKLSIGAIIVLLIAAIVFVFFDNRVTFAIILAAVVLHILLVRRLQKSYTDGVVSYNMLSTLGRELGTDVLLEKSGGAIDSQTVESSALVPTDERAGACFLRQGIKGRYEDREIALCDGVFRQSFQLVEGGKNRITFLSGAWIRVSLKENSEGDFRVLDTDLMLPQLRQAFFREKGVEKREEEYKEKGLVLYQCNGSDNDDNLPGPLVRRKILELKEYTPGKVGLSIRGDVLNVFIKERMLARGVSVRRPVTEKELGLHPLPELKYILEIARAWEKQMQESADASCSK